MKVNKCKLKVAYKHLELNKEYDCKIGNKHVCIFSTPFWYAVKREHVEVLEDKQ